jgi:hypothetical protein
MEIRLGNGEMDTFDRCMMAMRRLVQGECGAAFSKFMTGLDRVDYSSVKAISYYDVRSGLHSAKNAAAAMAENHLLTGDLAKKAKSLSNAASRLLKQYGKDGREGRGTFPKSLIPKIHADAARLKAEFSMLIDRVRKDCATAPSVGRRHK